MAKARVKSAARAATVADVAAALDRIAPPALAQSWDNVGLLAGDPNAGVQRLLLCIDLTPAVVDEARQTRADFVFAYHPALFKPISRLLATSKATDSILFNCIRAGIAVYSSHTALDAAEGGTNDCLAGLCGIEHTEPLEYVDSPGPRAFKLVTFVPAESLEKVADALFKAGAGRIGDYTHCSFRLEGEGTFLGGEATNPVIGQRGKRERVAETRLEVVVPKADLPAALQALRAAHPYEEPAFDIYPLQPPITRGIGRHGALPRPIQLRRLAQSLRQATAANCVQLVGDPKRRVNRAIILAGAAGDLPIRALRGPDDVIITGEIRHHDALAIRRAGASAVALGHWASERPVLDPLRSRILAALPGMEVSISRADRDPFAPASRHVW